MYVRLCVRVGAFLSLHELASFQRPVASLVCVCAVAFLFTLFHTFASLVCACVAMSKPSKLKYFCQMCNKQCRDSNGFKCHTESGSHVAQMKLFLADPEKYISQFSSEFEDQFFAILSDDSRVPMDVYNTLIRDSEHTHLNATRWTSLAEFVTDMHREGKLVIESSTGEIRAHAQLVEPVRPKRPKIEKADKPMQIFQSEKPTEIVPGASKVGFAIAKQSHIQMKKATPFEDDSE